MHIGQALDLVSRYDSLRNPLTSLGDYLDPELILSLPCRNQVL
ncbi:IS4 ORF [Escherichia coli H736]|nr:IS4 ORF [Escherichia coli H736]